MLQEVVVNHGGKKTEVDLGVSIQGSKILVAGGQFTVENEVFSLGEYEYDFVPETTFSKKVIGHLILEGGYPALLVDEVLGDGLDVAYDISKDPDRRFLGTLFFTNVPAGVSDLSVPEVVVTVLKHGMGGEPPVTSLSDIVERIQKRQKENERGKESPPN